MTSDLPVSAVLAWWGTAWLRGHAAPDDLLDAVIGGDATHAVAGMPAPDGEGTTTLLAGLAALRAAGASALGCAVPTPGDPVGLGGPREFNSAALEAGQAVVATGTGLGLVPQRVGAAVVWQVLPADRRPLPDVGEADRALRRALLDTADALAALDVARWRPEVADELMDLRHPRPVAAPPGTPARCLDLAGRGLQAITIVDLALEDDGGAVSAHEMQRRRDALQPLATAGRHAVVAACSPEVWPE
ncbi:hypothetical protein ACFP3Q_03370 [Nocardioides sp. GCM10027113]|uniref:hypothetical protein n=1 Tax=unclassified Nocardioides TaxID=2615069 RepID=UPI00360C528A